MTDDGRIDRLRAVGQSEFYANQQEWYRLRKLADMVMDAMEYHARQMDNWNSYLGNLGIQGDQSNVVQLSDHREAHAEPPTTA